MDIDDIFKRPALPKGSLKRKFDPGAVPDFSSDSTPKTQKLDDNNGHGKATIQEVGSDEEDSELQANQPIDDEEQDDEEGRFFGGGLTDVQKEVLQIMDTGADNVEELTPQNTRKQLLAFEKVINKNRDLRTKFSSEPEKFVDSEFALVAALGNLLTFSSKPLVTFPLVLELSVASWLADLMTHENPDVVIAVVDAVKEWTDEEVLDPDEEETDEDFDQKRKLMQQLIDAISKANLVDYAVSRVASFDEKEESERTGVFSIMELIENLVLLDPEVSRPLFSPNSGLQAFLIKRIGNSELKGIEYEQNKFYAAELLAHLLSLTTAGAIQGKERMAKEGDLDVILHAISGYRNRDPSSIEETEFMENVFDILCSCLSVEFVKSTFLEAEGIELLCFMLQEKRESRVRAVKALDFALNGIGGAPLCVRFVERLGLKHLFTLFMGKKQGKRLKGALTTFQDNEHVFSIIAALFTSLDSDSTPRFRLLAKFAEKEYEKVDRLLELRADIVTKVENVDEGEANMDEDEKYIEKLGRGLYSLQLIDYIIAWVCMEDDGIRDHILMLLSRQDKSIKEIVQVLQEYQQNLGDDEKGAEQKEILAHLIEYMESLEL